jgi:hypothetical protein
LAAAMLRRRCARFKSNNHFGGRSCLSGGHTDGGDSAAATSEVVMKYLANI